MADRWLTAKELAEVLHVDEQTIRRWANAGKIEGARAGSRGRWRFKQSEVERVMKEQAAEAARVATKPPEDHDG